jgi:hypothetical protein
MELVSQLVSSNRLISVMEIECFLRGRKLIFKYSDNVYRQIVEDMMPDCQITKLFVNN